MYNSELHLTLSYFSFYNYLCISVFTFASLIDIPIEITSFVVGLKTLTITAGTKKYKSIINKKKKKHHKIVLIAKSNLNRIKVSISNVSIDSNISPDDFVLINNVLKEYYEMNDAKNSSKVCLFIKQCYHIV